MYGETFYGRHTAQHQLQWDVLRPPHCTTPAADKPYSAEVSKNNKITSQTTTLKCTWWPLTPILTLYEVTQLGNRAKSVQECLRISIRPVAPYAAKVPTNPKISSYTTSNMSYGTYIKSHRRLAKAQTSRRLRAISSEHSLFAHMKYVSRRKVRLKSDI